jgi:ribosomal protein S18 acetylase RimI-like enzyme
MIIQMRPATPNDIPQLTRFLLMATGGLLDALYHDIIPGKSTSEIVERRFSREGTTSWYKNHWIALYQGEIAGGLHAYPQDDVATGLPDPLIPKERHALLDPLNRLKAPGSFEINVVAVYPQFRRKGIATRLLELARSQASDRGFPRLCLYVFEQNSEAVNLYRALGFEISGRSSVVAHELIRNSGDILMMTRAA